HHIETSVTHHFKRFTRIAGAGCNAKRRHVNNGIDPFGRLTHLMRIPNITAHKLDSGILQRLLKVRRGPSGQTVEYHYSCGGALPQQQVDCGGSDESAPPCHQNTCVVDVHPFFLRDGLRPVWSGAGLVAVANVTMSTAMLLRSRWVQV